MSKTLDKIIKILIYRFLGKLFLEAKWSSKYCPTSWERENICAFLTKYIAQYRKNIHK